LLILQEANTENKLRINSLVITHVEQWLSKVYGQYLLHCSDKLIPLIKTHTPYQFQFSNNFYFSKKEVYSPDICGHYTKLPFRTEVIDIILTPYLTDYEKESEIIMHEFFRILKPNGYLCIVGARLEFDQTESFFRRLYRNVHRLKQAYRLSKTIKQAGGIIMEKKYFFEWPQCKDKNLKAILKYCLQLLTWIIPNERHTFLIIAQKKTKQIQAIEFKIPLTLLSTIKTHHANR
jgi:SAM-dependent methyltransferase